MKQFILAACVVLSVSLCAAAEKEKENPFRAAPPEVLEAVKSRVTEFYTFFQEGKFRQAEALVTEESKDLFYNAPKKPLLGFEVANIEFDENFEEAMVLVNVDTITPLTGPTPMKLPVGGRWIWVNDNWFLHMEERKMESPFGKMEPGSGTPGQGLIAGAFGGKAVKPEQLANMYAVNRREVHFPRNSKKPVERSVIFHNPGPARLAIEAQDGLVPGLTVETGEGEIEPGTQREIRFTYDPSVGLLRNTRDVHFGVLPLMRRFSIKVLFDE